MCMESMDEVEILTFLGFREEHGHQWFFGGLQQLDHRVVDGILVLVQPTVSVVAHLFHTHRK